MLPEFKALLREQFFMLLIDEEAALAAIAELLPDDAAARAEALRLLEGVLTAPGSLPEGAQQRLERIRTIFAGDGELGAQKTKGRGKAQGAVAAPSRAMPLLRRRKLASPGRPGGGEIKRPLAVSAAAEIIPEQARSSQEGSWASAMNFASSRLAWQRGLDRRRRRPAQATTG
jgi:hypothetical protein